ncbi:MAG: enoyl-CoA hydratase [Deltaproteobacteria bacterium CG_4_8_14_3_um_filter_45_9]|nr:MAG: enoyl-CoA hydratase [Deltaproteobacteria bacterium CG03_land_8_20_14_0_80_45_14]PIX25436.1 MAG: enoyl-CoA hydratase [Deltaproteobacteria bacterium CG_4_8_14_3_um_filter_45_9]
MEFKTLLFDVRDNVAHIMLNRPEAANSINEEMGKDLMHAALRCDEDPEIRAVLITGAGRMFSGGGDLKDFSAKGNQLPYYVKEITTYLHAAISRLTRMDAPVVAAVQGAVAGAGMSIAIACDIVVAAETARFMVAYTRAGLTPDGSATYFLPRIIGLKRALELTLTNRMFSAQEALQWGLITRVVPDNELLAQARAIAVQLATGPTRAYGVSKRLLHSGWTETLETQMENESQAIANSARTADAREGITAFLEKRPAKYKGQ